MHRTARLLLPRQQRPYSTRSFEFSQLDKVQRYKYLCAAITPRPIAVISTTDKKGINNISMASFFAPVTSEPPTLTFSLTVRSDNTQKDTYNNICETGQFVVNCLTERFFTEAYTASQDFPASVDEFGITGLTPIPSIKVNVPRIQEAPVSMECTLYKSIPIGEEGKYGSATLIVGEVQYIHIGISFSSMISLKFLLLSYSLM
eukprot:TRINITY_DN1572_c0_g1_i3.p1 TRINITY_DN1572_c0_g1~~TRINITY_DN1572_c0_g1_i3.p1  ORF type:complete len:210 (-),score=19.33 TRINITY_DN1572_c0_g1_i3:482-1090(-)